MLLKIALICLGGALGSLLRYALASALTSPDGPRFPLSTLLVNVSGCFAIGLLATALAPGGAWPVREGVRLGILVGVLGGYTTFSSFGLETVNLVRAGMTAEAVAYVALSNSLGLAAVWLGWRLGAALAAAPFPGG